MRYRQLVAVAVVLAVVLLGFGGWQVVSAGADGAQSPPPEPCESRC